MKKRKIAQGRFSPQWNDVIQDVLGLLQDRKLACISFTSQRNDVVRDALV